MLFQLLRALWIGGKSCTLSHELRYWKISEWIAINVSVKIFRRGSRKVTHLMPTRINSMARGKARQSRALIVRLSLQSVWKALHSETFQYGLSGGRNNCSCSKHSSAVSAWKHASGTAVLIFISLITIRGGRLLKMMKAVSRRNIQVRSL
jgi:hypothetical protein